MNCCLTAANKSVNILLQSKKTHSFVTDFSTWTMQHEQASHFETGIEALFFCLNNHLKNMQILGEFLNPKMNFSIPVTDLKGD